MGAGAAREARVGGGGRAGWRIMSAAARNKQFQRVTARLFALSGSFVPRHIT